MEWDAPAIVLDARPYGEGDVVAGRDDRGARRAPRARARRRLARQGGDLADGEPGSR